MREFNIRMKLASFQPVYRRSVLLRHQLLFQLLLSSLKKNLKRYVPLGRNVVFLSEHSSLIYDQAEYGRFHLNNFLQLKFTLRR